MRKVEVLERIDKFQRALNRLKEAVQRAEDELDRDGVIQRFEFTFELLWKTLKAILNYQGVECYSPRDCIKKAFRHGIIDDDEIFLDMLEDRNLSSHVYDEETAKEIFERIKKFYLKTLEGLNLEEKL
jgi:nucleotidyltransferase substrate binding protein (TIGR01987 family)